MGKLTPKQSAMIAERLKDPTATNAKIIERAGYKATTKHSASQQYLENMSKPEISKRLEPVIDEVEEVLIDTVREFKKSDKQWERTLANDNAKWIHDKVKGKAVQRSEVQTTGVSLTIDLTSALTEVE